MAEIAPDVRPAPYRLGYQPGLDGLRAIAITFVVAAHAFVPYFTVADWPASSRSSSCRAI